MKLIMIPLVLISGLTVANDAPLLSFGAKPDNKPKILETGEPIEDYQHAQADKEIEEAFTWISAGTPEKHKAAHAVFLKYSQQGSSVAQYGLANMLQRGWGVEANIKESIFWLTESSKTGFPKSQYQLALAFRTGQGVEQNFKLAREWYEAAAIFGHTQAMVDLAGMHLHGMGMEADKKTAIIWLKKAASENYAPAIQILEKLGE